MSVWYLAIEILETFTRKLAERLRTKVFATPEELVGFLAI